MAAILLTLEAMNRSKFLGKVLLAFSAYLIYLIQISSPVIATELDPKWNYPVLDHQISRGFDRPSENWLAGHRGIDFAATLDQEVLAVGSGTVIFAGLLAEKGVVVISHGLIRTTYEPVSAKVSIGQNVKTGEVIGYVSTGISHCSNKEKVWCLHLGAIRDGKYLNPLLLVHPRVRLLPIN